jgi:hypothetical protein
MTTYQVTERGEQSLRHRGYGDGDQITKRELTDLLSRQLIHTGGSGSKPIDDDPLQPIVPFGLPLQPVRQPEVSNKDFQTRRPVDQPRDYHRPKLTALDELRIVLENFPTPHSDVRTVTSFATDPRPKVAPPTIAAPQQVQPTPVTERTTRSELGNQEAVMPTWLWLEVIVGVIALAFLFFKMMTD